MSQNTVSHVMWILLKPITLTVWFKLYLIKFAEQHPTTYTPLEVETLVWNLAVHSTNRSNQIKRGTFDKGLYNGVEHLLLIIFVAKSFYYLIGGAFSDAIW